jgi:hypothetical protein
MSLTGLRRIPVLIKAILNAARRSATAETAAGKRE